MFPRKWTLKEHKKFEQRKHKVGFGLTVCHFYLFTLGWKNFKWNLSKKSENKETSQKKSDVYLSKVINYYYQPKFSSNLT